MPYTFPALPRQHYGQLDLKSKAIFSWRSNECKLESLTDQIPNWSRSSAFTMSAPDVNGEDIAPARHSPAWIWAQGAPALLIPTNETLYYPFQLQVQEMTLVVEFVQRGSMPANGEGFFYIGPSGNTGRRLWIQSNGSNYRARLSNGNATVNSVLRTAPSSDDIVELRVVLEKGGSNYTVRIGQSINGEAEVLANESSEIRMGRWDTDNRLYLGSLGGENAATCELRLVNLQPGVRSLAKMRQSL